LWKTAREYEEELRAEKKGWDIEKINLTK